MMIQMMMDAELQTKKIRERIKMVTDALFFEEVPGICVPTLLVCLSFIT